MAMKEKRWTVDKKNKKVFLGVYHQNVAILHQIQELTTFYHQSWESLRSNSQIWKLEQSMSQQRTVESQAVDWVLQFDMDSHRLESWPWN